MTSNDHSYLPCLYLNVRLRTISTDAFQLPKKNHSPNNPTVSENTTKLLYNIHTFLLLNHISACIVMVMHHVIWWESSSSVTFFHKYNHSTRVSLNLSLFFLKISSLAAITCVFTLSFTWRFLYNSMCDFFTLFSLSSFKRVAERFVATKRKLHNLVMILWTFRSFVAVTSIFNMKHKKRFARIKSTVITIYSMQRHFFPYEAQSISF